MTEFDSLEKLLRYEETYCNGAGVPKVIAACTDLASMMEGTDTQPPRFRVLKRGESGELNGKIVCFERTPDTTADDCLVAISQYFTVMPRLLETQYAMVNEFLSRKPTFFNKLMAAQEILRRVSSAQMVFNMLHDIYLHTNWGVDAILERFGSVILPESYDTHNAKALTVFIVENMKLMNDHGKIYALIDACVEHIPVTVDRCDLIVTKDTNQWDLLAHSIMDFVTNHRNYPMDISEIDEEILAQTIRLALRKRSTVLLHENDLQLAVRQITNDHLVYILSQPTYVESSHFKAAIRALSIAAWKIFNKLATAARKHIECNQETLANQYAADIVHSVQGRTMPEETREENVAYLSLLLQICMKFITAC